MHFLPHCINNNHFLLTAGRTVFWEEEKTLILSDLHFGKSGHFRKNGIGLPQSPYLEDLKRLTHQLQYFRPRNMIIAGDLFHSRDNSEHKLFYKWRQESSGVEICLVIGNHDILSPSDYEKADIRLYPEILEHGSFAFVHDMTGIGQAPGRYYFSGHLHPGITLAASGRQSLHFPCFHFTPEMATLPAFGTFTGTHTITPGRQDSVYALVNNTVIKIK